MRLKAGIASEILKALISAQRKPVDTCLSAHHPAAKIKPSIRRARPINRRFCRLAAVRAPYWLSSSLAIVADSVLGVVDGPKRPTARPLRSIRNLVKFHLMPGAPKMPRIPGFLRFRKR